MTSQSNPFYRYHEEQIGNIEPSILQDEKPRSNPFYQLAERERKGQDKLKEEKKSSSDSFFTKSLKDIFTGLPGQIALGLTQAVTSPLDLMKLWMQGEALTGLDDAEEAAAKEGIPFNREEEQAKILGQIESAVPTLSMAEKWLNEQDISTNPQNTLESISRGIAEFAGLPKVGKAPKLGLKQLGAEEQALRETAEQFGLRKFAGMEAEKASGLTPIVSAKKEAKLAEELGETSKRAIDDLIDQKISVKKMRDEYGINLEDAYEKSYSAARTTAKDMGKESIDYTNVIDWIDQQIGKTKGSSPSLSNSQKTFIKVLEKEKKSLISGKGDRFDLITGKKLPPSTKKMTASQSLDQIKNFNENVKGIYRKPEFAGSENAVKNAYAGLNEQIVNAIEKANPELAKEISFANKIFHEGSKLDQVEGILKTAFKDGYNPNKLAKTLEGKRNRAFLKRSLGEDTITDLERIAKYGKEAEKRVFDKLKNPKTVKEYLNTVTPAQLALLAGVKSHVGAPALLLKSGLHRMQGLLFTRDTTRKAYMQFLKDAARYGSIPSSKALLKASDELTKAIENEYGSEEELIEMSNKD